MLLGLHAHLNSIFAHIIEYNFFYHIIEEKEIEVLQVSFPTQYFVYLQKTNLGFLGPSSRFETRSGQVLSEHLLLLRGHQQGGGGNQGLL